MAYKLRHCPTPRREFYREAEALFLEQMPLIPLFVYTNRHLVHASVHGTPGNVLNLVNYRYIWLEP
jgi:oligopeptide transport system substrate-binding protein